MRPQWPRHAQNLPAYPPRPAPHPLFSLNANRQQQFIDNVDMFAGSSDPYEDMLHGTQARPFGQSDAYTRSRDTSYGYRYEKEYYQRNPVNMNAISERARIPGVQPAGYDYANYYNQLSQYDEENPLAYLGVYGKKEMVRKPTKDQEDPIASVLKGRMVREQTGSFFNPSTSTTTTPKPLYLAQKPASLSSMQTYSTPSTDGNHANPENTSANMMYLTTGGDFVQLVANMRNGARLKKLLAVPENKDLWFETKTGSSSATGIAQIEYSLEEHKTYWYNPMSLAVTFEKPSPIQAHIMPQTECQNLLDMMTPCTLIVKRIYKQLAEDTLRNFFSKYGKISYLKICKYKEIAKYSRKSLAHRNLAYLRMETVQAQKKILEESCFVIEGSHEVEVKIPLNRIFISRVPDGTHPAQLMQFFSQEIIKMGLTDGYVIDAYFPLPYRQFAFCTVGGQQVGAKLAIKADYYFNNTSISVSSCHTGSEVSAENLFEQKVKDLIDASDIARVRSLQNISSEVKFLLQILSKMRKFDNQMILLMQINNEFLKCTEEKLRNYLHVQVHENYKDHVMDICKVVAMKDDDDDNYDIPSKRKRLRMTAQNIPVDDVDGTVVLDGDGEQDNFDEDQTANQLISRNHFVISSVIGNDVEEDANTHIVKIITRTEASNEKLPTTSQNT